MSKLKRFISLTLSIVLAAAPAGTVFAEGKAGFYEDFEGFAAGSIPDTLLCAPGAGEIHVIDTEGEYGKALYLECKNDGGYVSVSKKIDALYSNYPVRAQISFMQPEYRANGSGILQLYSGDVLLASVETRNDAIVYQDAGGYQELVEGYEPDRFYDIVMTAELGNGTVSIAVDGKTADVALLSAQSSIDSLRSYCRLSPGMVLDQISIGYVTDLARIELTGPDRQSIPASGEAAYTYTARGLDNKNHAYEGVAFAWRVEPAVPGVRLETAEGGGTARLIVGAEAAENTAYKIICSAAGNPQMSVEKTVTLEKGVIDRITISGSGVLVPSLKMQERYGVTAYDCFGNQLETKNAVFRLAGESGDFSITPDGLLTMNNAATDAGFVTIQAALTTDSAIAAQKKIRITDIKTYLNDMARRESVKEYLDTVIEKARDIYRDSPLLVNGIDKDGRPVLWDFVNGDHSAMTDLGNQQALMRTMAAYSALTGDETYQNKVDEIYRYTLENNVVSNLVLWGPHASMDMKTGKRAAGNGYHEVESKNMYLAPFFEADPEKTAAIVKQTWMGHIIDWDSLWFNRHASYGKAVSENNTWGNPGRFIENPEDPFIRDAEGQSFFVAASEYIHFARELYKETGDELALLWAKRLAYKYVNAKDSKTGMLPLTFTTGYKAPGVSEMPPEIWELPTMPYRYQTTTYGDRAYNQFAQPFCDQGKISEADMEHIIEAYFYETYPWVYKEGMLEVLELAKQLGLEDEQDAGFDLLYEWLIAMEKYLETAYDPVGNSVSPMFACGVKCANYRTVRCGYYGSRGRVFVSSRIDSAALSGVIRAAFAAEGFPSLAKPSQTFWRTARSMSRGLQLGDIGDPLRGVAPSLNFKCQSIDPVCIDLLVYMYENTGVEDYMKLARLIGNNICETKFSDGLFVDSETYSTWISLHEPLALMRLDAAINGQEVESLDYLYVSHVYLQERWVDDHGYVDETNQYSDKYSLVYTPVKVKSVRVEPEELVLHPGEYQPLEVQVLPDDAAQKEIFWEIDDADVVSIDFDNRLYAKGKGETYIRAVAAASSVISEPIKVTVE